MGLALGAQLLDQRLAVLVEGEIDRRFGAPRLGGLGHCRVELALRGQAERHRVLGLDVGDVPVGALAKRLDGGAGGADQLADLAVGKLGVVADQPGDAVRLVLPLGDRRVARALGTHGLIGLAVHLKPIIRVVLAAVDLLQRQLARAQGIAAGQLGRGGIVGDRLHLEDMKAAKFGDLLEGQRSVVDQPGGGRVRHERLGHGILQK